MNQVLTRLTATAFSLWGVATISFLLLRLTPGDPVDIMLGEFVTAADRQTVRHELGIDQPIFQQYGNYLVALAHGDLGKSFFSKRPVTTDIANHLGPTFELGLAATFLAIIFGIPLGVISAVRQNTWFDRCFQALSLIGISIPTFWLAPVLIIALCIKLDWLPVSEYTGFASLVLPAVTLATGLCAVLIRMTRAAVAEILGEDYVRTAQAKGATTARVFFKHALINGMTPIITVVSLQLGAVLTGVVITETIFDWPGLGILFFRALQARNYPLVQGCILTVAVIYIAVNLMTDVAYLIFNPKLRVS